MSELLTEAGFAPHRTEQVLLADIADLPAAGPAPMDGLTVRRDLGTMSTRFVASLEEKAVGFVEVNGDLTAGGNRSRFAGIGDVDNVYVAPQWQRRGIATWLMGQAADWLRLGRVDRVLNYADDQADDFTAYRAWMAKLGWKLLTRTRRGWRRTD